MSNIISYAIVCFLFLCLIFTIFSKDKGSDSGGGDCSNF